MKNTKKQLPKEMKIWIKQTVLRKQDCIISRQTKLNRIKLLSKELQITKKLKILEELQMKEIRMSLNQVKIEWSNAGYDISSIDKVIKTKGV